MKSFAILSVFVALVAQTSALTINTPASIVLCEPVEFTWSSDGVPPYFLTLLPGGQAEAAPLKSFPQTTGTSYTWIADLAAGTSITAALRDSTGEQVFADADTIQTSSNATCVNNTVDEGTTQSGGTVSTTSAAGGGGGGGASTTVTTKDSTTTTKSSTSSTSSSKNAAGRASSLDLGAFAIAGAMGLVGAALL